jgi:hypothetical protein
MNGNTFHSPTDSTWNQQEWTRILRNGPESTGIGLESTGIGPESTGIDWNLQESTGIGLESTGID